MADPFSIIVNGKRFAWAARTISYLTICSMAGEDQHMNPSVKYTGGPWQNREGILSRFDSSPFIADDMKFSVAGTGNA